MTSITPFNFNQGIGFGKGSRTVAQKAKNWAQNVDPETMDKIIKEILKQNSVETRTPEADYAAMKKMYDTLEQKMQDPKTTQGEAKKILQNPIRVAIQNLMYSKPLDFSFRDYNSKTAGDKQFNNSLAVTGVALVATGATFLASSAVISIICTAEAVAETCVGVTSVLPTFAVGLIGTGVCNTVIRDKNGEDKNNKIFTKYTEPQKKYLKRLTEYRDAMWLIFPELDPRKNPKARPLTLADFEAFIKEANKH